MRRRVFFIHIYLASLEYVSDYYEEECLADLCFPFWCQYILCNELSVLLSTDTFKARCIIVFSDSLVHFGDCRTFVYKWFSGYQQLQCRQTVIYNVPFKKWQTGLGQSSRFFILLTNEIGSDCWLAQISKDTWANKALWSRYCAILYNWSRFPLHRIVRRPSAWRK